MSETKERWLFDGHEVEFRCPLCRAWIPLYRTAKGKPHGFCRSCSFQMFLRMKPALEAVAEHLTAGGDDLVRYAEVPAGTHGG